VDKLNAFPRANKEGREQNPARTAKRDCRLEAVDRRHGEMEFSPWALVSGYDTLPEARLKR